MRDYKKYDVWVKAHQLTLFVYKDILPGFPKSEQYELVSQLKRASYSADLILWKVAEEIQIKILLIF